MKHFLSILLVICMLFLLVGCSNNPDKASNSSKKAGVFSAKVEGDGYNSPEEAALAYAKALQSCSVDEILSTFAVETYVENLDVEQYFLEYRTYTLNGSPFSAGDDYTDDLCLIQRQNMIANVLRGMYLYLADTGYPDTQNVTLLVGDDDRSADVANSLVIDNWSEILHAMQIGKTLRIGEFDPSLEQDEYFLLSLSDQAAVFGCDEIVPIAVEITLDGTDYYLCVDAASYDGRWYNLNTHGTIAALFGDNPQTGLYLRDE